MVNVFYSSIGNSFIRIDGLVQFTAIEEILKQFLDLRNTSGSTNQYNIMNGWFIHLGISKSFFNWLQGAAEQISIKFFKASPCDAGVEVDTFKE